MATFTEKLDCLVNGFVSKQIKHVDLDDKYPLELNVLILRFLGNIFIKFDLIYPAYAHCIQNDGTLLVRDNNISASWFRVLSSHAFTAGDIGEFKIKCTKPGYDAIGIRSNTDIIKEANKYHSALDGSMYYYHGDGHLYITKGYQPEDQTNVTKFALNDIITIKVDCVKWNVIFMKNDEMVGDITKIKSNQDYYPFVGFSYGVTEYQLICD